VMAAAVEEVDFPVAEDEEALAVVVAGTYHTVDRWPIHTSFASFVCLFDIRVVVVVRMVQVCAGLDAITRGSSHTQACTMVLG
jgi:hypothetical protein